MSTQPPDVLLIFHPSLYYKLAEVVLCFIIQVINEVIKQYWPLYQSVQSGWCPAGLNAAVNNPLGPVVTASHGLLSWPLFLYTYVVWEGVESFANIQVNIICFAFLHRSSHHRRLSGQAWFIFHISILISYSCP